MNVVLNPNIQYTNIRICIKFHFKLHAQLHGCMHSIVFSTRSTVDTVEHVMSQRCTFVHYIDRLRLYISKFHIPSVNPFYMESGHFSNNAGSNMWLREWLREDKSSVLPIKQRDKET